ncbi:Receptor-transporting protein 4 [Camelus dromedarius]|uniref:Receptor-transporting protein 4 n=1 Tax=Camelus dromedarius TaxID=9838 RepID=A0A5N4EJN0_CAMDR|nr:Receptor-transporting protein 4 [Camelus dromedarius]
MDSKPQSKTMALDVRTWEQIFQELIWQEKPRARWTLKLDGNLKPDCVAPGWKQYRQRGFGRMEKVPVFLMPTKVGFCPSADSMSHEIGAPEVPGAGAYEDFCSEVPEVFPVSI